MRGCDRLQFRTKPEQKSATVVRGAAALARPNVRCRDQDQINSGETSPRLVLRIARRPAPATAISYPPFQADELHQAGRVRCASIVAQAVSASASDLKGEPPTFMAHRL